MVVIVCTLLGGIGSEFAQHIISPFRAFDRGDIIANVLGSVLAIILSIAYRTVFVHHHRNFQQVGFNLDDEIDLQSV